MKIIGLTTIMLLAGCAAQPERIDTTPKNPTVVLKASGVISGAYYLIPHFNNSSILETIKEAFPISINMTPGSLISFWEVIIHLFSG